jgi:Skp family chaperone for outer membrane proteins|tara:strand:- start:273 stop:794 length:522 start_codon:yes stop_codon:yes gene_type:complete
MKKTSILFLSFLLFLNLISAVYSKDNIVFLDLNRVIKESKPGVMLIKKYEDIKKKNIDFFLLSEKVLKDEELKIISQKKILSNDVYKSKIAEFQNKVSKYNFERSQKLKKFDIDKTKSFQKMMNLITPILTQIAEQKSYSMIFNKESLIIGKSELDITSEVINVVNKKVDNLK